MTAFAPGNHQPLAVEDAPGGRAIIVSIPAVVSATPIAHHDYNWVGALNSARGFAGNVFAWLIECATSHVMLITAITMLLILSMVIGWKIRGGQR